MTELCMLSPELPPQLPCMLSPELPCPQNSPRTPVVVNEHRPRWHSVLSHGDKGAIRCRLDAFSEVTIMKQVYLPLVLLLCGCNGAETPSAERDTREATTADASPAETTPGNRARSSNLPYSGSNR